MFWGISESSSMKQFVVLTCVALLSLSFISKVIEIPSFSERKDFGEVSLRDSLSEASGIAASEKNPNIVWTHNDSGDKPRLFAMNTSAEVVGIYYLDKATNRDWEAVALGKDPKTKKSFLFVGDIGDNNAQYGTYTIYKVPEPVVSDTQQLKVQTLSNVEKITFNYPDGKRDAETLMYDQTSGDLLVVSKREDSVRVYRLAYPQSSSNNNNAEYICSLPYSYTVAGDISRDGMEMILKTYQTVYYYKRSVGETWKSALKKQANLLPYDVEPQGEAIAWSSNGGYYTLSEESPLKVPVHLYYYERTGTLTIDDDESAPTLSIHSIFPNPSNSEITIRFSVNHEQRLSLDLFDVQGNSIRIIADRIYTPGIYNTIVPIDVLNSGSYTAKIFSRSDSASTSFIVTK